MIQHAQVTADQTAFPVLLTAATLPSEMLVSGGSNAAQADGGDIRFSTDADGVTQLACEVVVWDQSGGNAEIWVPVHILTAADVTIYVWYHAGGGLTQPAAGAAFGAQAVWDSSFVGVWHMQEATGTTLKDSTSNAQVSTKLSATEPNPSPGQIQNGQDFDGVNDFVSVAPAALLLPTDILTVSAWARVDAYPASDSNFMHALAATQDDQVVAGWTFGIGAFNNSGSVGKVHFEFAGPGATWHEANGASILPLSTKHLIAAVYNQTDIRIYVDGVLDMTPAVQSASINNSSVFKIGRRGNSIGSAADRFWDGIIDELRISTIARSASWLLAELHNQNAPSSFVIAGTPASVGGGAFFRPSEMGTRRGSRQIVS